MESVIRIHDLDNVAVACADLIQGGKIMCDGHVMAAREDVPRGHKIALRDIRKGEAITKYGFCIGYAIKDISQGDWVHLHNIRTGLSAQEEYRYSPACRTAGYMKPLTFSGYLRNDNRAAVRNEVWILPTVGCVNGICSRLAEEGRKIQAEFGIDGVVAFPHPYGCSQMGDDQENTQKLLAALIDHPNAGGVLLVGLGCENSGIPQLRQKIARKEGIRYLVCQNEPDELKTGLTLLRELAEYAGKFKRRLLPTSKLVLGMKCGGSDGFSGITANPALGALSDMHIAMGGSTILTEVPEMFGAEKVLFDRCVSRDVFDSAVNMINAFKQYFVSHSQVVYDNPSPGNKMGGISTLEEKSLGCVQKGGTMPVTDVIRYAEQVRTQGLTLLSGPGNDLVSATALAAAGVHIILFSTGRGTPLGAPVPVVKISSNSELLERKKGWIDFDAGGILTDDTVEDTSKRLLAFVQSVACGKQTQNEIYNNHEVAIFKNGVTL